MENFDRFDRIDYPTVNPTEWENEGNYLAIILTKASSAKMRGEITKETYDLIHEQVMNQKSILSNLEK